MAEKLTPWFPGDVKPVRPGIYRRDYGDGGQWFSRWSGLLWSHGYYDLNDAARTKFESMAQSLPWRGLAQDPSKEGV